MGAATRLFSRAQLLVARFQRGMTLGVRGAVFDAEGRVFLVRHSYTPGWYMPGGGVDPGETMEAALGRELREEGNIELTGRPVLFGVYLQATVSPRDHVAVFVCRAWRQPAPPKVPNLEIVAAGFHAPDALPEGTTPATRRRLAEIAAGSPGDGAW